MNTKRILTGLALVAGLGMTLMAGSCDIQPDTSTKTSEAN